MYSLVLLFHYISHCSRPMHIRHKARRAILQQVHPLGQVASVFGDRSYRCFVHDHANDDIADHAEPHHVRIHVLAGVREQDQRILIHDTNIDVRRANWLTHLIQLVPLPLQVNGHTADRTISMDFQKFQSHR